MRAEAERGLQNWKGVALTLGGLEAVFKEVTFEQRPECHERILRRPTGLRPSFSLQRVGLTSQEKHRTRIQTSWARKDQR